MRLTETQRDAVVGVLPGAVTAARRQARSLPVRVRDDAVCEAMLAVCEAIRRYDVTRGEWQPFANTVARGSVIDFARVWLGRQGSKVTGQLEFDVPAVDFSFEARELLRAVAALPYAQRVCLVHGAAVASRLLRITVPAAQSRRHRALSLLSEATR